MKAAVVILNWNGSAHLRRFLPSVVRNTPRWASVVVVDNGSTDDSVATLVLDFPSVRIVALDRNYGFAEGYNRGLAQVEAEVFVLLNSDVYTPIGWLEPLLDGLLESDVAAAMPKILALPSPPAVFEYAGAAGGFLDFWGYPFCRGRILSRVEADRGQYDDSRDVFWASGAAMAVRALAFQQLGGFKNEFFAHQEEIDLCWRAQLLGWRVRVEPRARVFHLGGGTLQSGSPLKTFLNHRNNLAMVFSCGSPWQVFVVASTRPFLDLLEAGVYVCTGRLAHAREVTRAWGAVLKWLFDGTIRRAPRHGGRVHGLYGGSIILRYLFGRHRFGRLKI